MLYFSKLFINVILAENCLFMRSIETYRLLFIDALQQHAQTREPKNLYQPIAYILRLGGKRLRPVLTLMASEIFGGKAEEALNAALAVEIFHNFSLVHDDIMDKAPLRRGQPTVHAKWDLNTGILSGDAMLILAYQFFENYDAETFKKLAKLFSKTALEVCEGQQYDVDFETRNNVTVPEYVKMITYKTAVLLGGALKMGAYVAGANEKNAQALYDYGVNLGIAFQLKDDYLDAFGNPETFGKQVGGDIIENKKTFLYLKALENLPADDAQALQKWFSVSPENPIQKVEAVKQLMVNSGADALTLKEIETYTQKALQLVHVLPVSDDKKMLLTLFANQLMERVG